MTLYYFSNEKSYRISRKNMAHTLKHYRSLGLKVRIVNRGQSWMAGRMSFQLKAAEERD